jgi:hypothetical protein
LGVVALLFWIKKDLYKLKDWLLFGLGVIIPNITYIWHDRNLVLWLPYRIINIANKSPLGTYNSLTEYFGRTFFWDQKFWIIGFVIFVVLFCHYVYTNRKNIKRDFLPFFLTSSIGIMLIANILHGAPPIHYFLPIFTIVPILSAIYLAKIKSWPLIIISVLAINIFFFFKDPQFYGDTSKFDPAIDLIPYAKQEVLTSFILFDSKGHPLSIKRIGPFDYFPEQYSQNYKYLILWKGGQLTDNGANVYTITENERGVSVQK